MVRELIYRIEYEIEEHLNLTRILKGGNFGG